MIFKTIFSESGQYIASGFANNEQTFNTKIAETGISEQKVIAIIEKYLAENTIETGATEEQVAQINANTEAIAGKVDIEQGAENKDKLLAVGEDGRVMLISPAANSGISEITIEEV